MSKIVDFWHQPHPPGSFFVIKKLKDRLPLTFKMSSYWLTQQVTKQYTHTHTQTWTWSIRLNCAQLQELMFSRTMPEIYTAGSRDAGLKVSPTCAVWSFPTNSQRANRFRDLEGGGRGGGGATRSSQAMADPQSFYINETQSPRQK